MRLLVQRYRLPLFAAWLALLLLGACAAPDAIRPTPPVAPPPAAVPTPTGTSSPAPTSAAQRCPTLAGGLAHGVNVFALQPDGDAVLRVAADAGFGWVRQQIHWRDVNGDGVRFDWRQVDAAVAGAARHRLRLMLSVVRAPDWASPANPGGLPADGRDLADFMQLLAARYAGRVAAYEVWNEPNLAVENGGVVPDPARYLDVLLAVRAAIKRADPCALVLAAPLAATATNDPAVARDDLLFYEALYQAQGGAFLRAADAVAVHTGGGNHPPEALWPADAPEQSRRYFRHLEALRALMQRHGDARPVWVTEYGWTVTTAPGAPPPVSEQQQADYIVGAMQLTRARYPWVAALFVWNLNFAVLGAPDDEKSTFGIYRPDGTPRPAYLAVRQALTGRAATPLLLAPPPPVPPPPRAYGATPTPSAATGVRALRPAHGALQAAWSPDGQLVAAAGVDGVVRVWQADAALLAALPIGGRPARVVAWSPDGQLLAAGGRDGQVTIWQRDGWRVVRRIDGDAQVAGLAWNPRGSRLLVWGWSGTAQLYEPQSGRSVARIVTGSGMLLSAAWHPGGQGFALGGWGGFAGLYNAHGVLQAQLQGHTGDVAAVGFAPDGTRLASASADGALRLWAWPRGTQQQQHQHTAPLTTLAWGQNGQLAAGGLDGAVLDITKEGTQQVSLHAGPVWSLLWAANGALLSGGSDGQVLEVARGAEATLRAHADGPVWSLDAQPITGRVAVGWNAPSGAGLLPE